MILIESKNSPHAIVCDNCGRLIDTTNGNGGLYLRNSANYHNRIIIDDELTLDANGDICSECHSIVTEAFRKAFKDVCEAHKLIFSVERNY